MNLVLIEEERRRKEVLDKRIEDEFEWRPIIIDDYQVPELNIELPLTKNRRKILSKVLSFIGLNQHRRSSSKCTIMPIPTNNKRYIDICGSPMGVSNLIKYMIEIGLIEVECEDYSYNNNKAKAKTYRYYYENEIRIIDICKEWQVELKRVSNKDTLVKSFIDVDFFDKSAIRFSSALTQIRKPDNWSEKEFEDNLDIALHDRYVEFDYYQAMADYINETYYENYPKLWIRYKPNYTWQDKFVKKIGIRATNNLCSAKNDKTHDDEYRVYKEDILREHKLNLHYDVKSSVPRITLSMNKGYWIDESVDLYKVIWNEYIKIKESSSKVSKLDTLVKSFYKEQRDAVKSLFMPVYFEEHSQLNMCKNVRYSMANQFDKEEVYEEMKIFDEAVHNVLGQFYYSEIFYHESNIYMEVLKELLDRGYFVWQVYDSWYARKDGVRQEDYENEVRQLVEEKANEYINMLNICDCR